MMLAWGRGSKIGSGERARSREGRVAQQGNNIILGGAAAIQPGASVCKEPGCAPSSFECTGDWCKNQPTVGAVACGWDCGFPGKVQYRWRAERRGRRSLASLTISVWSVIVLVLCPFPPAAAGALWDGSIENRRTVWRTQKKRRVSDLVLWHRAEPVPSLCSTSCEHW